MGSQVKQEQQEKSHTKELKCKNCKNKIQVPYKISPYSTENRVFECPICHEKIKNKENREWAISTKGRKVEYILIWVMYRILIAFAILAVIATFITIALSMFYGTDQLTSVTKSYVTPVTLIALPIVLCIVAYKTYPRLRDDIENSKIRLKDRAYVKALKKVGYKIPDEYLK